MPRWRGVVARVTVHQVVIRFDDGQEAAVPREKAPKGVKEGAIVHVSVSLDRIANLLKHASFVPERMPSHTTGSHGI